MKDLEIQFPKQLTTFGLTILHLLLNTFYEFTTCLIHYDYDDAKKRQLKAIYLLIFRHDYLQGV